MTAPDHSSPVFGSSRREFLSRAAGGVSLTLLGGPAAFADAAQARRKLVAIICRGALDGLSATPPVGDPDYAGLRGAIALRSDEVLAVDGHFGLHPKLPTSTRSSGAVRRVSLPPSPYPSASAPTSRRRTFSRAAENSSTPPPPDG